MRPALSVALIAIATGPAAAEGERALSFGLGWATFSVPGEPVDNMAPPQISPDIGGAASITYEHSISTDFSLRVEGAFGAFYGGGTEMQSKASYAGLADVGGVFRFDVLKYVPYLFGGLGVVTTTGGPIEGGTDFVVAVGGGLDILLSRERSYGFELRLASFGGDTTVFTAGARYTIRWGYF